MSKTTSPQKPGGLAAPQAPQLFRGRSLEELLPQIRAALGDDAVVLRQREGLSGGVGGFFQQRFVEVQAVAGEHYGLDRYDDGPAYPDDAPAAAVAAGASSPAPADAAAPTPDAAVDADGPAAPAAAADAPLDGPAFLEHLDAALRRRREDGVADPVPPVRIPLELRDDPPAADAPVAPVAPVARPVPAPAETVAPAASAPVAAAPAAFTAAPSSAASSSVAPAQAQALAPVAGARVAAAYAAPKAAASAAAPVTAPSAAHAPSAPARAEAPAPAVVPWTPARAPRDPAAAASAGPSASAAGPAGPSTSAAVPAPVGAEVPAEPETPAAVASVIAEPEVAEPVAAERVVATAAVASAARPSVAPAAASAAASPAATATTVAPSAATASAAPATAATATVTRPGGPRRTAIPAPPPRLEEAFRAAMAAAPRAVAGVAAAPDALQVVVPTTDDGLDEAPRAAPATPATPATPAAPAAPAASAAPATPPAARVAVPTRQDVDADVAEYGLIARGLTPTISRAVVQEAAAHAQPLDPGHRMDRAVRAVLARRLPRLRARGDVRTLAVVGAPGAGRTSAVGALARAYAAAGRSVLVVALGAADGGAALRGAIVGTDVELLVASAGATVVAARDAERPDLCLVDTAAVRPGDAAAIAALADELRAAGVDEVHLAVPGTDATATTTAALDALAPLDPGALLMTHRDQAERPGGVVGASILRRTPVSYVTDGRAVAAAEPARLARMVQP